MKRLLVLSSIVLAVGSYAQDIKSIDDICDTTPTQECKNNPQDIKLLQQMLNSDKSINVKLDIDGKWGKETKQAVIKFQKTHNISPTEGYVGYRTKNALNKYASTHKKPKKYTQNNSTKWYKIIDDICDTTPTQECKNNPQDIKLLQQMLNSDKSIHVKLDIDGKWGKETKQAVIKFQKTHNISPTEGYVGYRTKNALNSYAKITHKLTQKTNHKKPKKYAQKNSTKQYDCYTDFKNSVNLKKSYAVYKDKKLLANTKRAKKKIIVDVSEQRVRLYVDGKVALDAPCTTGAKHKFEPNTKIYRDKHTPLGTYRITEKIADKRSTIFGDIYKNGRRIYHGDRRKYKGSWKGVKFVGASLKHWMRLTSGGIGLHASKYVKRYPGTNGCIRLPYNVAHTLFAKVDKGTVVKVVR
jgi:peptidoglycan hydrolase-like protein with peptidoglycan-binding domain